MFATLKTWIVGLYERVMPSFWFALKPQYQWAFGIAIVVVLYLLTGLLRIGGHSSGAAVAKATTDIPSVRVAVLNAVPRDATLTVRGRTQALHEVDARAEVDGVVSALHFEKGDRVKKGQVLCEIKLNDRGGLPLQDPTGADHRLVRGREGGRLHHEHPTRQHHDSRAV